MATTIPKDRFADLIPEQSFDLTAMPRGPGKANALESLYDSGFNGAFLPTMDGMLGAAARYYQDEFRAESAANRVNVEQVAHEFPTYAETEYGYVASVDAFQAWERDKAADAVDWLFRFLQNWGNCVGASGVEMFHGMLGTRAMIATNGEAMKYLMASWAYAFRGYCGHGWYGSRHASVTRQYGYCFAFPEIAGYQYGDEQSSETYTSTRWCSNGPPSAMREFVDGHKWRFGENAIYEMTDSIEALRAVSQAKGQFHHGSNVTSGSGKPDVLKRIGGHQQTTFGVSWHPLVLGFYESKGLKLDSDDAWTLNHQTWGSGFSGECADSYWPYGHDNQNIVYTLAEVKQMSDAAVAALTPLFGQKPEGAWVCGGKHLLRNVGGYAYLPDFRGLPSDVPPPPPPPEPDEPTVTGSATVSGSAVVADLIATGEFDIDGYPFVLAKQEYGTYKLVRKT